MAIKVYLADLRHDYCGVLANDCMPLGIAYMKAVMDKEASSSEINSRLFVYPDRLLSAIKNAPPDVLMLSNYVWNEGLARFFVSVAKRINPNCLTVMGGPNIPIEPDRQQEFVLGVQDLDAYILGEGDFRALEMVRAFRDANFSVEKLAEKALSSCIIKWANQVVYSAPVAPRNRDVSQIASPWLTGVQDEFFDGRLAPMIETNRGCPFTCTFCSQGTSYYTKVNNFPIDRLKEEIDYIARHIQARSPQMRVLRIADSNYGMYERDVEISSHIGKMQRDFGWPTFIDATTGKNRPERIIKSLEQVGGALVLYQAVQSLDENVLLKIKRDTIKLSAYKELEIYMRGRGLRSVSDLILGLPCETLDSHLSALRRLIDSNIDQLHNMQAMLLKGAELETRESRQLFRFETRFRILPRNFGSYGGTNVFDIEEIVVSTDTLSFDDYLTARKWHLISSVFWNDGWFSDVVRFCREWGISNSTWWSRMLPAMESGAPAMCELISDFVDQTMGELFVTRSACEEFYNRDENFERLRTGEIGDNLMYRFRAIASFYQWEQICSTAMEATRYLLEEHRVHEAIPNFNEFYEDFATYIRLSHATGRSHDVLFAKQTVDLRYDLSCWLQSNDMRNPHKFRFSGARVAEFGLSDANRSELEAAFAVWGTTLRGLSKLVTRISTKCQMRDCKIMRDENSSGEHSITSEESRLPESLTM